MNKLSWKETIIEIAGTMKTDDNGEIVFTAKQFKDKTKFTATLVVADKSPLSVLARKNVWIFMDGLRKEDVEALKALKDQGKIDASTRWVASGHLVRTPGKPGMNDILNLKVTSMRLAGDNETPFVDFDEALSKDEWQVLKNERFNKALAEAPVAPTAPSVPF